MLRRSSSADPPFQIIDRFTVDETWNGQPMTVQPTQNVNMPRTPNGSMVLAYQNLSLQNNAGTLSLTSGGSAPQFYPAPALTNQPSILAGNWKANNLSVTNISPAAETPIQITALGPGIPGLVPSALPTNGTLVPLAIGGAAQGDALPQWMNLVMASQTSQTHVFALIGGPVDVGGNNAYLFEINAASSTGPLSSVPPPAGYYATTTSNQYAFQLNWGSSTLFVANLSGDTASLATVCLYAL